MGRQGPPLSYRQSGTRPAVVRRGLAATAVGWRTLAWQRQLRSASSIIRRQSPNDGEWRRVSYMIFELPNVPGSFTEPSEWIRAITEAAKLPWLQAVAQFRLADAAALQIKLRDIVRSGGEGLMLHCDDASHQVRPQRCPALADALAGRRSARRRASARQGKIFRQARCAAQGNAGRSSLRARQRPERRTDANAAAGARADYLSLSRTDAAWHARVSEVSAGTGSILRRAELRS